MGYGLRIMGRYLTCKEYLHPGKLMAFELNKKWRFGWFG